MAEPTISDDRQAVDAPGLHGPEWVIQLTLANKAEHTKEIIYYGPFAEYGAAVGHLPGSRSISSMSAPLPHQPMPGPTGPTRHAPSW